MSLTIHAARRRRTATRTVLAIVTAASVLIQPIGPATAVTVDRIRLANADGDWKPSAEKSVPGHDAKPVPRRADPAQQKAIVSPPTVSWPAAGSATTALPPPTASARSGVTRQQPPSPASPWRKMLGAQLATSRPAKAKAGSLPIEIGPTAAAHRAQSPADRAAAQSTPASVAVTLLGRKDDSILFRLRRVDKSTATGPVSVSFDYSKFQHAYGGDWNSRLRLATVPECALRTPSAATCRPTPLATRNDGSGTLTADTSVSPAGGLYAVQAGPSGPAGDLGASSLSPAATWQVGGSSGDFGWRYPMALPPGNGGPDLQMTLDYSSGSVDGRTTATNNQPSWAGEGFEFAPGGAIERRYAGCGAKSEQNGNNGTRTTGDLCWATDNATFSLNGKGGELVRDDATGQWIARADDGSTIERFTGANNGDNNGEYWVMTSADGTKYYFGLNRLTGWTAGRPETQSTWTVPVFGNNSGEPCHQGSFADSHCAQAYRWNLDYVVDRHGNTMSFFYDVETNYYARNFTATSVSKYIRAGNLSRIEYGQRDGAVYTAPAIARVVMSTADRCLPGTVCTPNQPSLWPDTPWDQSCTSSSRCDNKFNPTFWTQKRLATVRTEVWRGTAFQPVSSWTLRHTFPDPGDGTRPGMWLEGLAMAGHVGDSIVTPEVNFDGVQLPNRVAGTDGIPALNWWRISAVHYGTGGELAVAYSAQDCSLPGNVPAPDTNTKRCHPAKWTPEKQQERQDWFNKYVAISVSESDRVSGLEPVVTRYEYLSPPAWRHDEEDGLVEIGRKTWSQWRGYEHVRVTKGSGATKSVTEQRFFRGMDGDKLTNGGVKNVYVTDSAGGRVEDINPLAGQVREQVRYNGTTLVDRSISDEWVSAPRATRVRSWGTTQAFQVQDAALRQDEAGGSGLRSRSATNTYTASGLMTQKSDLNDLSTAADDTCTRYSYVANATAGMRELPVRKQSVAKACDQPWTKDDVTEDVRTFYDGNSSLSATPTYGDVTKVEELSAFDSSGTPIYKTKYTATYDALGRQISQTDAAGQTTTRTYTPAQGGPVTRTVITTATGQTAAVDWEPAWGEELVVTQIDGRRTEVAYDALGRTSQVWKPGRQRTDVPTMSYEYVMRGDGANVIKTSKLQADNSIGTTLELTDGLQRVRQRQQAAPGGGRTVTDFIYDSRGQLVKENGPYFNSSPPNDQVLIPVEQALPIQKVTTFDGVERPLVEQVLSNGNEKWHTSYSQTAGVQTVQPPSGEQAVTRISDVEGKLIELRQYRGNSPTGGFDSTTYTYTAADKLATVTDPAGNRWQFEYDLRGRKVKEVDPDKGTSTYAYDDRGLMTSQTDGRGNTLAFGYDELGRRTGVYDGSLQGAKRTEWSYDSTSNDKPSTAVRYVDGQAYTSRVTGYDAAGNATGTEVTLPSREGALAGKYEIGNTYSASNDLSTTRLPEIGGLPAETLTYGYNQQNLPTTLSGATSYVTGTNYTPYGEIEALTLSQNNGKWVQQLFEYETGTRRLTRQVTERETLPQRISSVTYAYDPAGNIKQLTDQPSAASSESTDSQCFAYDHLRRLTDAWTPSSNNCAAAPDAQRLGGPAPYWQSWTFDAVGNRTSQTNHAPSGTITSQYEYPRAGDAQPHALQKVTTTGPTGTKVDTYDYDTAGNLTTRTKAGVGEVFTWDAEGHLEATTKNGRTTSYIYDADGNRLIRRDSSGTTFYLGQTEVLLSPAGVVSGTRYYRLGDRTVAVRTGSTVAWLGNDHHGTPELAIDADSQSFQRKKSTPYGETRGAAPTKWPGQRTFVGGVDDADTGLVHLQAREYDPTTGRFISVDPLANYQDAQQLNGYAYANNSPVTFSDPDGKSFQAIVTTVVRFTQTVKRVVEAVPTIVRTVVPVIRTIVSTAFGPLGGLITILQKIVTFITIIKTIIKTIVKLIRAVERIVTTVVKLVWQVAKAIYNIAKAVMDFPTVASRWVLDRVGEGWNWVWNKVFPPKIPVNKKGEPYPQVTDIRTGKPMTYPGDGLQKVPPSERVKWGAKERGEFIKQWYDRGYQTPPGGWAPYDIHHIRPREYGGSNDFDNLVPIPRVIHEKVVTPWWVNY